MTWKEVTDPLEITKQHFIKASGPKYVYVCFYMVVYFGFSLSLPYPLSLLSPKEKHWLLQLGPLRTDSSSDLISANSYMLIYKRNVLKPEPRQDKNIWYGRRHDTLHIKCVWQQQGAGCCQRTPATDSLSGCAPSIQRLKQLAPRLHQQPWHSPRCVEACCSTAPQQY